MVFSWRERIGTWDVVFVVLFLLSRMILNLSLTPFSIFFVIVYAGFLYLLLSGQPFFRISFVIFLILDSLLGTYFAFSSGIFDFIYWGTMIINLAVIILVLSNRHQKTS